MARRDRVPRHKSHTHKRNQNAKLSPFQREQKRAKLANQVPTAATIGSLDSIPHSQRKIFQYLQEKRARQAARNAVVMPAASQEEHQAVSLTVSKEGERDTTARLSCGSPSPKRVVENNVSAVDATTKEIQAASAESTSSSASKKKTKKITLPSLNEELSASVGPIMQPSSRHAGSPLRDATEGAGAPRTVEEIIARKKERKHKRKQEARRARVAAQLQDMEEELEDYTKVANGSRKRGDKRIKEAEKGFASSARERANLAFERELRSMKKEEEETQLLKAKAEEDAGNRDGRKRSRDTAENVAKGPTDLQNGEVGAEGALPRRKRISFDPEVAEAPAAQKKKPQDFYELVDVVRYGERVEAPPVFDVLPNKNAAVSRLATALERDSRRHGRGEVTTMDRHRLLAGGGQLAQQKRLARLGLAPALTQTTRADAASAATRMSKQEEITALRDRVMATYQRNRRSEVVERKGVDMKHAFPKFS